MGAPQHDLARHRLTARPRRPAGAALRALACAALLFAASKTFASSDLADLIQAGESSAALARIAAGTDVDAAQGDGTTPLHWAVYRGDVAVVDALLAAGAQANVVNLYGASPLSEAVKIGHAELAERLLAAGADPESPNADGQTALMLAARAGATAVAHQLVRHGADVNTRERWRGQTALMWAADSSAAEIVKLLVASGADVEVRGFANDWPTQVTSEPRGQYRPTGGMTALLYAARAGCTDCVAAMLDAGAEIDRPSPDGVTPLMIAIDNFRFDTAKLLLERGANPHYSDWWGRTALYIAVDMSSFTGRGPARRTVSEAGDTTALDIVRALLEAGVDPNTQLNMHRPGRGGNSGRFIDDLMTTGATPLLRAAIGADAEAARLLLEHGALVDLPNVMGVTPLMAAAGMGVTARDRAGFAGDVQDRVIATLDVLLGAGANIHARVTDTTSRTARIARPSTMTDREGQTALYGAIRFGWERVVQYLIERGAEVDIVDALGRSPVDAALGRVGGRGDVVSERVAEILHAAGA